MRNISFVAFFFAHALLGACARGDQNTEIPGLGDVAFATGDDSSLTSPPNPTSSGTSLGAGSGDPGTTSGIGTSGDPTSGLATSGTTGSGSPTNSTGSATSGSSTTGTAGTGAATSGSPTGDAATAGAVADATATSDSAASDAASTGNAAPRVVARLSINGPDHVGIDYPGLWHGSPPSTACGPNGYQTNHPLHGTNDASLFRGEVNGNPVTCTIGSALASGMYRVRLYFAEIYWGPGCAAQGGAGARVFDIVLEGTTVLRNFDVFAESGGCLASTVSSSGVPIVKTFDISVKDGTLDISLPAAHDMAKISALEVFGPL